MPMHELLDRWPELLFAALTGLVLGGLFFGSLWWTVRRMLSSGPSVLWQLGGLLVRVAVILLGFYAVGAGHWERLLACLVGFLVAKLAAIRMTRRWERRQAGAATFTTTRKTPEADHAPQP